MTSEEPRSPTSRVECLDGLRGIAAIWVLLGHAMVLSGWKFPIVSGPDIAVDLFMILSGFLMCFHYVERRTSEPWSAPATWRTFWIRRFFRLAPLYYLVLAIALCAGPVLGQFRDAIAAVVPGSETEAARYLDHGWKNVLLHISFLFGFSPTYGYRTALPDWSLALEMTFYASFPFLMIAGSRLGFVMAATALSLLCAVVSFALPDFFNAFVQPSFLPIKLPIFCAGILVAASLREVAARRYVLLLNALFLCMLPVNGDDYRLSELALRGCCLVVFAALADCDRLPSFLGFDRAIRHLAPILGGRMGAFLGETSYSVYLLHLLILIPTVGLLIEWFRLSAFSIFLASLVIAVPVVYLCAAVLHVLVERPGI